MRSAAALSILAFTCNAIGQPTTASETRVTEQPKAPAASGPDRANWWNDCVFYEIFVRSFADSKDGKLAGDGIGDIQGLIEHLDYLNDGDPKTDTGLGIGGIWLMPICPSPSYHGYDITNYTDVNPQFGTNDDFKRLIAECHKRGIKVIIDLVLNHTSNQHPWFVEAADPKSRKHDWYIWSDTDPGWKGPWNEKVWHRLAPSGPEAKEVYYYGIFSPYMPDLNYRNVSVTEEMKLASFFWLSNMGADGFRLDAIRHLIEDGQVQENTPETHAWLRDWYLYYKGVNLDAMSIGEVWGSSESIASYRGQMDMGFEFPLADAMVASAKAGKKDTFIAAQKKALEVYPPNQYGRFLSNHDQARVMTQLKGDGGAMRAAAALLLTGPGVPFIYYGEELGMTGGKPDEHIRTPMQWGPGPSADFTTGKPWEAVNSGLETVNVEKEAADPGSLLNWYKKLIHMRNAHPALATGGTWMVESDKPEVVAFLRRRATRTAPDLGGGPTERSSPKQTSDTVLVAINLSDHPVEGAALSIASSPLRAELTATDLLGGAAPPELRVDAGGGWTGYHIPGLAPRAAMIVELKPKSP